MRGRHPNTESIERYVLGYLATTESATLEEHFLICNRCRVLTAEAENYLGTIRSLPEVADVKPALDVFLCHNLKSKPAVKRIGRRLERRGIRPWLDEWQLRPGVSWQRSLEDQIQNIKSAAVFVDDTGIGPWQDQELQAFLREFVRRTCPVIPVILPGTRGVPDLPVFLRGNVSVDFRKRNPRPLDQLIWGITGIVGSYDG